jgi:hypothetical protein
VLCLLLLVPLRHYLMWLVLLLLVLCLPLLVPLRHYLMWLFFPLLVLCILVVLHEDPVCLQL